MLLLTPVIMVPVVGSMMLRQGRQSPEMRPFLVIGGLLMVLLCLVQFMANQFGFDRDGFRVFVLSAAPGRDILLGKNLGFARWRWECPRSCS